MVACLPTTETICEQNVQKISTSQAQKSHSQVSSSCIRMRRIIQFAAYAPSRWTQVPGMPVGNAVQRAGRGLCSSASCGAKRDNSREGQDKKVERPRQAKKGLFEMASDKLSKMSGASRSAAGGRETRSTSSKRAGDQRPRDHRSLGSVKHEKAAHRFTLDLGEGQVARIDYKPLGGNKIELFHTEVPEELRGRGIGKQLARGALECASKGNLRLRITCEYLEDYLKRSADAKYKRLLVD